MLIVRLLPAQKAEIDTLVRQSDIPFEQFQWGRIDGRWAGHVNGEVPVMRHKPSDSYFSLSNDPVGFDPYAYGPENTTRPWRVMFHPGSETWIEQRERLDWRHVVAVAGDWLRYLRLNLEAVGALAPVPEKLSGLAPSELSEPMGHTIEAVAVVSTNRPRVFISYAHESEAHKERSYQLAERLRSAGINAEIDQYHEHESVNWPQWMMREIKKANFVLVIASESYKRRFEGDDPKGIGAGAKWEGAIIKQELYEAEGAGNKFIPVSLTRADEPHIPTPLRGENRFLVDTLDGYTNLYRRLTGQPARRKSALGALRELPPETLATPTNPAPSVGIPSPVIEPRQTARTDSLLSRTLGAGATRSALPDKLRLLDPDERAFVILELLDHSGETNALLALAAIMAEPTSDTQVSSIATALIKGALFGELTAKARLMNIIDAKYLSQADARIRRSFFAEVIEIMLRDQYDEVNLITPAVVKVQDAIPAELHTSYMEAILAQTRSQAYQGQPAARRALAALPEALKRAGLSQLDFRALAAVDGDVDVDLKNFVAASRASWAPEKAGLFDDYLTLDHVSFVHKWHE